MDGVQFEPLWKNASAAATEEVKSLWRKWRAISDEALIETRAGQVVYVIRDRNGEVGGVSTARPVRAAFLNNHMFYEFRCFIAPPFRAPGLDTLLAIKTKQLLEEEPGSPDTFKGMMMIIENPDLRKRNKAIWNGSGMVFAGYTARGHHIRVGYFKKARI